ncbi:MAG: sugar-binding domain-containing protein, partial [Lentisphaeria bacterium]
MNYKKIDLNGSWSISYSCDGNKFKSSVDLINIGAQILPARVPGNFELDLQRVGKISDPFYGMNMLEVNKLENCHVYYFRSFNAHKIPETDPVLIFEGLDTFADVYLNGCWVTSCSNMLVEHKIPIGKFMKDGKNEIFIHIRPAVAEAEKQEYPNFLASGNESIWVRKAPHMYGWDIMPRAVSAGIWRPVFIEFQPYERFDTLYLETVMLSKDYSEAQLHLNYSTTLPSSATASQIEICIEGNCGNSKFFACEKLHFPRSGQIRLGVENPKLWWPRGSGLPQLYDVKIYLKKDGIKIDERNLRFGIRFVELLRTSLTSWDGEGEFLFKINHENIFMKGSNWVPLDAFHSRDAERLEKALEMVADLECNILRCWGG